MGGGHRVVGAGGARCRDQSSGAAGFRRRDAAHGRGPKVSSMDSGRSLRLMDDDYLRNIQRWLGGESAIPRKVLDSIWDACTEAESPPMIPLPRTSPE